MRRDRAAYSAEPGDRHIVGHPCLGFDPRYAPDIALHKSEREFPVKHLLPESNFFTSLAPGLSQDVHGVHDSRWFFRIIRDHRGAFAASGCDSTGAERFRETLIAAFLSAEGISPLTLRTGVTPLAYSMNKLIFPGLAALVLFTVLPVASAGRRSLDDGAYPDTAVYESNGRNAIVRKVQLLLEKDGYYVGDHSGEFGFETRAAVRRYRRDHGLPITGKIDAAFLRTLGFR